MVKLQPIINKNLLNSFKTHLKNYLNYLNNNQILVLFIWMLLNEVKIFIRGKKSIREKLPNLSVNVQCCHYKVTEFEMQIQYLYKLVIT